MNILILSPQTVAFCGGGVERVAIALTEGFSALGHRVFHLAWEKSSDAPEVSPMEYFPVANIKNVAENAAFFERFLRERQIDAILYQWGIGRKFPFPQITRKLGIPVAALFHNQPDYYRFRYGFFERIRRYFSQRAKYRWNFDACDALVLLSDGFRPMLEKHLTRAQKSRSREKIFAIGNPATFPPADVDFSQKRPELLMVGLDVRQKRPDLLFAAWQKIQNRVPAWSLKLLGTDEDTAAAKAIAANFDLQRVEFCGFRPPQEFYRRASIYCMTSSHEGFPMVLGEAAAFGCARVAFDTFPTIRDIIESEKTGILVPAGDIDAYAGTLLRLIGDADLRAKLGGNARRDLSRFTKEAIAQRWIELFERLKHAKGAEK